MEKIIIKIQLGWKFLFIHQIYIVKNNFLFCWLSFRALTKLRPKKTKYLLVGKQKNFGCIIKNMKDFNNF